MRWRTKRTRWCTSSTSQRPRGSMNAPSTIRHCGGWREISKPWIRLSRRLCFTSSDEMSTCPAQKETKLVNSLAELLSAKPKFVTRLAAAPLLSDFHPVVRYANESVHSLVEAPCTAVNFWLC